MENTREIANELETRTGIFHIGDCGDFSGNRFFRSEAGMSIKIFFSIFFEGKNQILKLSNLTIFILNFWYQLTSLNGNYSIKKSSFHHRQKTDTNDDNKN